MTNQEIQKYLFAVGPEKAKKIREKASHSVGVSTDGPISDNDRKCHMVMVISALKAKQEQVRCYQCGKIVSDAEQHVSEYGNQFMWVCS